MVRIPNEMLRKKIVKQEIWHIGTTLFYVAQWSPNLALKPPSMESIPLWAKVEGIPFDLITQEGLSLLAGLIGEPVETDDYTKNLTNLRVAHLKVKENCTKPLPYIVEILRQNGWIFPLAVEYPWTPPTYPNCHQLGHLKAHCPTSHWVPKQPATTPSQPEIPNVANALVNTKTPHSPMESVEVTPVKLVSSSSNTVVDLSQQMQISPSSISPVTGLMFSHEVNNSIPMAKETISHLVALLAHGFYLSRMNDVDPMNEESAWSSKISKFAAKPI